jgi:hypothetical protein
VKVGVWSLFLVDTTMITIALPTTPIIRTIVERIVNGKIHQESSIFVISRLISTVLTSNTEDAFEGLVYVSSVNTT